MKSKNRNHLISWLAVRFLIYRLFLLLVAVMAVKILPFKPSFPYWETLLAPYGHPAFWSGANFDGVHYLNIAASGYSFQYTQAFFPLYPLLIRYLDLVFKNPIFSGLFISHISFFLSLVLFSKLIRLDREEAAARKAILYLLVFPTSFYFICLYSESLFLALSLGAFYAARKKHWLSAGLLGALASATRVFGIFLLPALIIEWHRDHEHSFKKSLPSLVSVLLSASGLASYMYFLHQAFSDSLLFLHVQPAFGAQRSADKFILLYQVFWRYLKMLASVDISSLLYYTISLEAVCGLLFLILVLLSFKHTRLSYAVYALLAFITPTLTGTLSSLPRYVLLLFPGFIVLSLVKNKALQMVWWLLSAILLALNYSLFLRGYWIA